MNLTKGSFNLNKKGSNLSSKANFNKDVFRQRKKTTDINGSVKGSMFAKDGLYNQMVQ